MKQKRRWLLAVVCCVMNSAVWAQSNVLQDTLRYEVNPLLVRQHFDGWGVSLCWWAGQCGKWDDEKIDEIVTWLVSPEGLNYNHFRYNIGGGDDPFNRHCTPHHMGRGKGLRAEMEGFKDSLDDVYHWDRDAAQRKIMLKIKEKRPDAVFEAFSNSCPYYMTYSGCVGGHEDGGKDNLRPEYYEAFAHYLVDVCKHYKDTYGIEFKTLAPFNESAANYWHANGSQEGCHFDYESQIKFIQVLEPILRKSGLNTVISAADETNVGQAIAGLNRYVSAGIDQYIGQWNTHTYGGNNEERIRYGELARKTGKHLWMSETGAGGNGIAGNLSLTQRLFDDMRYIQPEAWIDWQYMEEANDQWCTIRGSFANQTYAKVKNYYVRQQCSRFIKPGYTIINSDCRQSLAALNTHRDTLVIVILNQGKANTHDIDLHHFPQYISSITAYRTSENEDLADAANSIALNGSHLFVDMPSQSITTLVIHLDETHAVTAKMDKSLVKKTDWKPRLVVCTDIAPADVEPDDMESMVRLMSYADQFEIEALITTVGWNCDPYPVEWAKYLQRVIEAYQKDVPKLMKRSGQRVFLSSEKEHGMQHIGYWPSADYLKSRAVMGSVHGGIKVIGEGNDSQGSDLLIRLADEDDPRPIYVAAWGGANTLAQAIWRVKQTRSPEELKRFVQKFRIYTITDQDMQYNMRLNRAYSSHQWLRQVFPDDLQFVWDEGTWQEQCELGKQNWPLHKNHIQGKGALGKEYPDYKWGVEGDTPSFLYVLPNGLNDPEDPRQAGWAGYHERGLCADSLTTAWTSWQEPVYSTSVAYKKRFYPDEIADFMARMQWADEGKGNRNPQVIVNNSKGLQPLVIHAKAGSTIRLNASKSKDPDGDALSFHWWQQPEIGKTKVDINPSDSPKVSIQVPHATGDIVHLVCEVHDNGPFHLVSYRRIIIYIE